MTETKRPDNPDLEQPLVSHLLELRDRILRMVLAILAVFLVLFPFANDIYVHVATPLMAQLPAGTSMIATEVASPFLTPFKLSLVAAVFVAMPYILYQFWAFVAPGLYLHEKRLATPLVASSVVLFYLGMAFAYYVVFPLVFAFLTGTAPEGVAVMTDIARYLDFVLTLFFAFGIAFEVPIATILLVSMGMTTPDQLAEKRPYIVVAAFVVGMFLTPPDVISQTLLALPMWVLFELGVLFSRLFVSGREDEAVPADGPVQPEPASGKDEDAVRRSYQEKPVKEDSDVVGEDISEARPGDADRFVPMTEEEMEAELDAIEAGEDKPATPPVDPTEDKLREVQKRRDQGDTDGARALLYEVLEEGSSDQRRVARNILAQLDSP